MKMVIGLVGEKGGGKGTFAQTLQELMPTFIVAKIRFSDVLSETLGLWHIEKSRANLQKLPVIMRQAYGATVLSDAIHQRVLDADAHVSILDGVRWDTDYATIRGFKHNILVYITADIDVRYRRLTYRNEKRGESESTFEQFLEEEQATTELTIPAIAKLADYTIVNNGHRGQFDESIREFHTWLVEKYY